jgi:hypothetical protein
MLAKTILLVSLFCSTLALPAQPCGVNYRCFYKNPCLLTTPPTLSTPEGRFSFAIQDGSSRVHVESDSPFSLSYGQNPYGYYLGCNSTVGGVYSWDSDCFRTDVIYHSLTLFSMGYSKDVWITVNGAVGPGPC